MVLISTYCITGWWEEWCRDSHTY